MADVDFVLRFDPGPYPLACGAELSVLEVVWGLRLGSFNPGTQLVDIWTGRQHAVRQEDGRLYLEPPCDRIENHEKTLHPDGRK